MKKVKQEYHLYINEFFIAKIDTEKEYNKGFYDKKVKKGWVKIRY